MTHYLVVQHVAGKVELFEFEGTHTAAGAYADAVLRNLDVDSVTLTNDKSLADSLAAR